MLQRIELPFLSCLQNPRSKMHHYLMDTRKLEQQAKEALFSNPPDPSFIVLCLRFQPFGDGFPVQGYLQGLDPEVLKAIYMEPSTEIHSDSTSSLVEKIIAKYCKLRQPIPSSPQPFELRGSADKIAEQIHKACQQQLKQIPFSEFVRAGLKFSPPDERPLLDEVHKFEQKLFQYLKERPGRHGLYEEVEKVCGHEEPRQAWCKLTFSRLLLRRDVEAL